MTEKGEGAPTFIETPDGDIGYPQTGPNAPTFPRYATEERQRQRRVELEEDHPGMGIQGPAAAARAALRASQGSTAPKPEPTESAPDPNLSRDIRAITARSVAAGASSSRRSTDHERRLRGLKRRGRSPRS